jgi:hypothetical protein
MAKPLELRPEVGEWFQLFVKVLQKFELQTFIALQKKKKRSSPLISNSGSLAEMASISRFETSAGGFVLENPVACILSFTT